MKKLYSFILIGMLVSCTTTQHSVLQTELTSNCNQENSYNYSKSDIPKPLYEIEIDTVLSSRLKEKDLNVANAIGLTSILSEYIHKKKNLQQAPSIQNQLDLISLKQKINSRMDLASLEISSVAAELDCEEERITQIASFLKEKEMKTETRLTVGSIILGSLTAIVTGALVISNDESKTAEYIGVGVGIADAALGVMILTNHRKIELKHPRNVLREIWLATETSTVYPPSIWYYLNYSNPQKGESSLREQLILNWKNYEQVSDTKSKNNALDIYFSDGGIYSTDQLENRANMYDQIESTIKLMKQDLRNLGQSIEKL